MRATTQSKSVRSILRYALITLAITAVFYLCMAFRRWELSDQTRSFCLGQLKTACAAYLEDRHDFPKTWKDLVDGGYLQESSCLFACPYVDNRVTPLPRHWSKSDFVMSVVDGKLLLKLDDRIHIQGWSDEEVASTFATTLERKEIPDVPKAIRKQILIY
jgi:hypothetical protein